MHPARSAAKCAIVPIGVVATMDVVKSTENHPSRGQSQGTTYARPASNQNEALFVGMYGGQERAAQTMEVNRVGAGDKGLVDRPSSSTVILGHNMHANETTVPRTTSVFKTQHWISKVNELNELVCSFRGMQEYTGSLEDVLLQIARVACVDKGLMEKIGGLIPPQLVQLAKEQSIEANNPDGSQG